MDNSIRDVLALVQNPCQYTGNEINAVHKSDDRDRVKIALGYPDLYGIGMSSLGVRILYGLLNEHVSVACERFFAPQADMEELLRRRRIPLFSLESGTPVRRFDVVAFSLCSELNYTNVLNLLDLAGIPLRSQERGDRDPLVMIGGNSAFNPLPLVPFADIFVVGEGEEVLTEIVDILLGMRGRGRGETLERIASVEGVFVPEFPSPVVRKRVVKDLDSSYFPHRWLVPLTEIVHDRISLEIMRGCGQGCRFCQAGRCWRPVRVRSPKRILDMAEQAYAASGYEEMSLLSFSSGDHPQIEEIVEFLVKTFADRKVAISLPSLRIDTFSFRLANRIRTIRKTGLTFAPETGERLRQTIGKPIRDEELMALASEARAAGWKQIKLYFMLGLPGETPQDIRDVTALIREISRVIAVRASFATFVPRAHTPLQAERLIGEQEWEEKRGQVRDALSGNRFVKTDFHPYRMSCVETFLGRGDERMAAVLHAAWKSGARMENWIERFDFSRWQTAFAEASMDMGQYTGQMRGIPLPWEFVKV